MNKLLSSGYSRLKKDKVFWCCMAVLLLYSVLSMLNGCRQALASGMSEYYTLDKFYFSYSASIGLACALFTSMYLGTDYRDGTIRNKLIIGHTRPEIYLSNLIICITASVSMLLVCLLGGLTGLPVFGTWKMGANALLWVLISILFTICFCGIFTFVGMLSPYKSMAQVISILLFFALLLGSSMIYNALEQPEMTNEILMTVNGMQINDPTPNPAYVSGLKRDIYQFLLDFLPSGQAVQMFTMNVAHPLLMGLSSILLTITTTIGGICIFQKKNLY